MKSSNMFLSCKECGRGMTGKGLVDGSIIGGATLLVAGIAKNGETEYICTDCRNRENRGYKKILSRRDRRNHLLWMKRAGHVGKALI